MTTTPQRLYSNNARTTLASSIGSTDTSILVTDASKFAVPGTNQYITVTIDSGTTYEIIDVFGISGNTLTGCLRGQEGTSAQSFLSGTRVENRVTAATLSSFARLYDRVADLSSVDNLDLVANSSSNSYLCASVDDGGTPILAVKNGNYWRFANHPTRLASGSATIAGTTTGMTIPVTSMPSGTTTGAHIISFITGANAGLARIIQTASSGSITWATALPNSVAIGDQYQIYQSSSFTTGLLTSSSDDALIFSILFGA